MRPETPVIYFIPRRVRRFRRSTSLDFRGGILNEFYPNADATANGGTARR